MLLNLQNVPIHTLHRNFFLKTCCVTNDLFNQRISPSDKYVCESCRKSLRGIVWGLWENCGTMSGLSGDDVGTVGDGGGLHELTPSVLWDWHKLTQQEYPDKYTDNNYSWLKRDAKLRSGAQTATQLREVRGSGRLWGDDEAVEELGARWGNMFTDDSFTQNCFEKKYDWKAAGFMTFIWSSVCTNTLTCKSYRSIQDYTIQDYTTQDYTIQDYTIQDQMQSSFTITNMSYVSRQN